MEKVLTKKDLPEWLKRLGSYKIYTPLQKEGVWSFEILTDPEKASLDYPNAVQSPKKTVFPQREILFEFAESESEGFEVKETLPDEDPVVFFGVRPCDAKALTLTDEVFGGDIEDLYYWNRRKQTVLVGLSCNTPPSLNCFCLSVDGSPHSTDGLDILLTELGDKYYVESITKKGEQLVNQAKNIFKDPKDGDEKALEQMRMSSKKKILRQIKELKKLPPKLKEMFDSPFWEEESLSCIRFGICTYLCPTCHCFDINDEVTSPAPLKGKRIRTWDNCQFPDFTMHSSGHNPRPDRASRLRQRLLHKFQYFVELHKKYQCTGCGRCISKCPVGIDIIEVLNKVKEYES